MRRVWLWWSSGKDSAFTLHVLRQRDDVEVTALVTTVNEHFDRGSPCMPSAASSSKTRRVQPGSSSASSPSRPVPKLGPLEIAALLHRSG